MNEKELRAERHEKGVVQMLTKNQIINVRADKKNDVVGPLKRSAGDVNLFPVAPTMQGFPQIPIWEWVSTAKHAKPGVGTGSWVFPAVIACVLLAMFFAITMIVLITF